MAREHSSESEQRSIVAGYANYFEVGHKAFEFLIDFGQIDPQNGEININSRLALGPTHAKLFARLLDGAVQQFESRFGAIPEVSDEDSLSTVLDTTPDFERRAIDARSRPVTPSNRRSASKAKPKR